MDRARPAVIILWMAGAGLVACDEDPETWTVVTDGEAGALLSVWGASADDVWAVGTDRGNGEGPLVVRVQGDTTERLDTGQADGDLWWIHGFEGGPIFMGGSGGVILKYEGGTFSVQETPGTGTVFGIWGAAPDDVWAVGGESDAGGGFAWRLEGDRWVDEPSLPGDVVDTGALWKAHGISADDAWLVGSNGLSFHWDGQSLQPGDTGVGSSLFTVFGDGERYVAVGGLASGIIVENSGSGWENVTPDPLPESLAGVSLDGGGSGIAVGLYGTVYGRRGDSWEREDLGFVLNENLHGAWIDPDGGAWAAGGNTLVPPYDAGVLLRRH